LTERNVPWLRHGYIQLFNTGTAAVAELTGLMFGGRPAYEDPASLSISFRRNSEARALVKQIEAARDRPGW
jgi:hypothetical protein